MSAEVSSVNFEAHDFSEWSDVHLQDRLMDLCESASVPHNNERRQAIAREIRMITFEQRFRSGIAE